MELRCSLTLHINNKANKLRLRNLPKDYISIMAPKADATVPTTTRSRRSLSAQFNRKDKENATVDIGVSLASSRKTSRSKSMGPGGLDALKQGNGNRRVVR